MKRNLLFILTLLTVPGLFAQDSTEAYKNYFGFGASRVSGIGLMFGVSSKPTLTFQGTIGIFRTSVNSFTSFGFEMQYNLQNSNTGRIYIGPAFGGYDNTYDIGTRNESSTSEFVFAFAMGVSVPITGLFDNRLSASASLYYPTFYKDNSIGVGIGGSIQFLF